MLPMHLYVALKSVVLAAIAVTTAQLLWAIVTPPGPLGQWRPASARFLPQATQDTLIATVNPFAPIGQAAVQATVSLPNDLKLFGVRDNLATGGGGAIIAAADGKQVSVAVGEEISPGIVLVEVGFDFAVVERGGARQRIFLDQDKPAETVGAGGSVVAPSVPGALTAAALRAGIAAVPRAAGGTVSGVIVSATGDGAAFRTAGFQPGDVIVSINGARISSPTDAAQLLASISPGSRLALIIERGGQQLPLSLVISDSQ